MTQMICCCCGSYCPAMQQWHNRDNGFSICKICITHEKQLGISEETLYDWYGVAGIHYEKPE